MEKVNKAHSLSKTKVKYLDYEPLGDHWLWIEEDKTLIMML